MKDKEIYTIQDIIKIIILIVLFIIVIIFIIFDEVQKQENKENNINIAKDSINYYENCVYIDSIGWIDEDDYNQMCWDSVSK